MAGKHTIHLKVRGIDNGYIVTGYVENRVGRASFPESYVPSLAALDQAISEKLGGAEKMASEIKAPKTMSYGSVLSLRFGDDDDGDDD